MKVVVDIPYWLYDAMQEHREPIYSQSLGEAVRDGTPIPKGHGKLIDADKIGLTDFECLLCNGDYKEALKMLEDKIKNADAIIEADKEEGA